MAGGERRRSFGIGGAGNIRTREEAMVNDMISPSDAIKRRRSSSADRRETNSSNLPNRFKNMFRWRANSTPEVTK
ncbi:hypothetical protein GGR54DRAFT_636843 [Hypoxylon sp. NC1633]|nr:hypothetical protein GGR54DRAFT_636843 [Hypoxylon sp. NC1633]